MKNKDVGYSVDLTFRRQKNMKKILATALFACSLFLATPQVQAYSELDLLEGNWYDDNGKLFAIVRDGKLNTFRMDMITMAGSPGNFAAAVQVQEPNGFRNVPVEYSNAAANDKEKNNPFFRPAVRMNGVEVHKEWFKVPAAAYDYLDGHWYDADNNLVAFFRNGTFNTYPMTFLSFYGVGDHFDSIFQVNDHGTEKYFALSLHPTTAGMRISIRRLGVDDWSYASLHQ
jgi:hypothetical protein